VTPEVFVATLDAWLADFRSEALRLFDVGVPTDRLMSIALAIADAKAIERGRKRPDLSLPGVASRRN
jgi:hypothetical protein